MKIFLEFIKKTPSLRLKFILIFTFLILLPAKNHYYSLDLSNPTPLIRPVTHQLISLSKYPINSTGTSTPLLSARSAIIIDASSKSIIYQKNPDQKLLPASTTKIVTGLVALEIYDPEDIVTIKSLNGTGQKMGLEMEEKITIKNLLYGLLVQSGNDAATALAQFHPQGQDGFIDSMNQKTKVLGLKDTQFTNASGLDAYGHYTTVHDLALLTTQAMKNETFRKMVSTQSITVSNVDHTISHELETINQLLGVVPGLVGVKTGWTDLAGECLVTYTKRGNREIITVILGSLDRFGESASLIDWVFANYQWTKVAPTTHS